MRNIILHQSQGPFLLKTVFLTLFFSVIFGLSLGYAYTDLFQHKNFTPGEALLGCGIQEGKSLAPHIPCLKSAIFQLLNRYTAGELMGYLSASTTPAVLSEGSTCHTLGHLIGGAAYQKTDSVEVALAECSTACAGACVHGVIISAFTKAVGGIEGLSAARKDAESIVHNATQDDIVEKGKRFCMDLATCHAMGHLLYQIYNGAEGALPACDQVAQHASLTPAAAQVLAEGCYEGVFMEGTGHIGIWQTGDEASAKTQVTTCHNIPSKYQIACFRYFPKLIGPIVTTAGKSVSSTEVQAACDAYVGSARLDCFAGVGFSYGLILWQHSTAQAVCSSFTTPDERVACVIGQIVGLGGRKSTASTTSDCSSLSAQDKTLCYRATFQTRQLASYRSDAQILNECLETPDSDGCTAQFKSYVSIRNTLPYFYSAHISDLLR